MRTLWILVLLTTPLLVFGQPTYIYASEDCFVRAGASADLNQNSFTSAGDALRVRMANTADNLRRTYIKFDLSSYSGTIGSAKLQIWVDRAINANYNALTSPLSRDTAMFFKVADDSWSEFTITWNNAPPYGDYLFTQVFNRRVTADPDTMYEWDVTAYVQAEYAGNKIVTFFLADTIPGNGTDLRMYSHETLGFEPTLVLSAGSTGVSEGDGAVPDQYGLMQNYPNPFNPTTVISYAIPKEEHVRLEVFDLLGHCVATLVDGMQPAGNHSASFQAEAYNSGVYFYRLTAGSFLETRRMVLTK